MKDNQFMLVLFKEKEEVNMKIVLLNGSPRRGGNTEIMINTFMENVKDHDVVKLNIASMNIKGCLGCKYCWSHQGECVQKDDMEQVWTHLKEADVLIFGSPIYWFDMTAQLKTVIDRMYAGGSTGFHFHKTALLLDAGADHVFDAAISQYKAMISYLKWEDLGIICVPNMEDKGSMKESSKLAEVIQLAKSL
jgi:multimeric flavodoxin WrbA